MNTVQIFSSPQFGEIRTSLGANGEPLFCLADVCNALNLNGGAKNVKSRLNGKGVVSINTLTSGGSQQLNFITEPNLYKCIFQSRKKEAEAFQDWVCNEVLPSIRKSGGYMTARVDETPEQLFARALLLAQDTVKRQQSQIARLEAAKQTQQLTIEAQENTIREQAPKVTYHDRVLSSESTYTATQIAKEFGWGAQTLNQKLYRLKVQYKLNGQWLLYAHHANKGYTRSVTVSFIGSDGEPRSRQVTEWTEKGRAFIHSIINTQK